MKTHVDFLISLYVFVDAGAKTRVRNPSDSVTYALSLICSSCMLNILVKVICLTDEDILSKAVYFLAYQLK